MLLLSQQNEAIGQTTTTNTEANQSIAPLAENFDRFFWEYHKGKPESYRAVCEKPQNRADADLCQQWRMAEATVEQANLTDKLLTFTIIEIVALIAVLGLNICALIVGRRATCAAIESNEIARFSSERALRAYVHVDAIRLEYVKARDEWIVVATIKNLGQTPSANGIFRLKVDYGGDYASKVFIPSKKIPHTVLAPIPPGGQTDGSGALYKNADMAAFFGNLNRLYAYGRVEYRDAWGKKHGTWFRMTKDNFPIKEFSTCPYGNRST